MATAEPPVTLRTALEDLLQGADLTPIEAGVVPTPGQLWHKLLVSDPNHRLTILAGLQANAEVGWQCQIMDHKNRLEHLARLEAARPKVAWSAPSPEDEDCMCRGAFHYPNCPHGPKDGE